MSLRLEAYRLLQAWVVEGLLLPRVMSDERLAAGTEIQDLEEQEVPAAREGKRRAWFHAASVGELESLTPLVLEWAGRGDESVVTVLSESARSALDRLRKSLGELPGRVVFSGYSPWEGRWARALDLLRPELFVTAKYEAWPELWIALRERGIPLSIVSAKARRSLRVASALCRALGGRPPRIHLMTVRQEDGTELRKIFGEAEAEIRVVGEPRWDRVEARARQGNARAKELIEAFGSLPRPWGALGSVWPEDMELWRGRFAKGSGTLWVVPHRVDPAGVEAVEKYLVQAGLRVARTSLGRVPAEGADSVLVDELGFLLELYSAVDWAYVGGGFGISMHSTIEPALFGIPVSCGPNGMEKFAEVVELTSTGQLTILRSADELDSWLENRVSGGGGAREAWREQGRRRLGATRKVLEALDVALGNVARG